MEGPMVAQTPDTAAGAYYVTVVRGMGTPAQRVGRLAGPFAQHADALALVERARAEAERVDPWVAFDAVGTARFPVGTTEPGRLNARLGIEVTA